MAELTLTETTPAELRKDLAREQACDEGRHEPNPLYTWRCVHCWGLLCARCREEIDRCDCSPKVRHG